jgi:hypothetical protein
VPFPQAVIASLEAHSVQIAEEATQRMLAEIPAYSGIPAAVLAAQNQRTVVQIAQMMDDSNFPIARAYFEDLTERRSRRGIPIADFLQATEIMMAVVRQHVQLVFADEPAYRDRALRVLQAGTVFTQTVIGRRHLEQVVNQTKPARPTPPGARP